MFSPRLATDKQDYYMRKASALAFKSNLNHKHGCIVVNPKNDEILSNGYNYTYTHMYHKYSCHAECDALRKIR